MAEAKFKVTDRAVSDLGTVIHTTVELLDADGTMVEYGVKEYHDDHQGKIIDVEIENMATGADVKENSIIGKAVLAEVDEYNTLCKRATLPEETNNDDISPEDCNQVLYDIVQNMSSKHYLEFCHEMGYVSNDAINVSNNIYDLEYDECVGAIRTAQQIIDDVQSYLREQQARLIYNDDGTVDYNNGDDDNISVSEKVNYFLAELGINDDEFEDHIHTLIVHYKHVQVDIPCSAELDNEMYNESI